MSEAARLVAIAHSAPNLLLGGVLTALCCLAVSPANSYALPSGYAYEMVSPADKNGGQIPWEVGFRAGSGAVSESGDRVAYTSRAAFAGAGANAITNSYMGNAPTAGETIWSTRPITPPFASSLGPVYKPGQAPVLWVSSDQTKIVVATNVDPVTLVRQPRLNLYYRDLAVSPTAYVQLTPDPASGPLNYYENLTALPIVAATKDLSQLVYTTTAQLTPDSIGVGGEKAYMVDTATGGVTLVSTGSGSSPPGVPADPSDQVLNSSAHNQNVISADGSTLVLDARSAAPGLFRKNLDTGDTVAVSKEENSGQSVPLADASFADATPDGRYIFFITDQKLVDADTNAANDLYRWDAERAVGQRLKLISVDSEPADGADGGVSGTIGTSEDGSRVYFTTGDTASFAAEQLVAGAPTVPSGSSFLFLWDDGEIKYIGSADNEQYTGSSALRSFNSDVSPDGSYMTMVAGDEFFGTPPLTPPGDNSSGQKEVYLYGAEASTPLDPESVCVSCPAEPGPSDREPEGRSYFTYDAGSGMFDTNEQRYVSNDGRVVFTTPSALLSQDSNEDRYDVYTYKDGVTELISSGRDPKDSHLYGADRDLSTIAFTTAERLTGWDVDGAYDAYVAELGGGVPEPDPGTPPCVGNECRADPPAPPRADGASSSTFIAPGNPNRKNGRDRQGRRCKQLGAKKKKASRRAKRLRHRAKRADRRGGKRSRSSRGRKRVKRLRTRAKHQRKRAKRLRSRTRECRRAAR